MESRLPHGMGFLKKLGIRWRKRYGMERRDERTALDRLNKERRLATIITEFPSIRIFRYCLYLV